MPAGNPTGQGNPFNIFGQLIGSAFGYYSQMETNKFNRAMMRENRDWMQYMSNTAYQRATADMRAAGINPILAFSQGGASSHGGPGLAQALSPADKAMNMASAIAQIANIKADSKMKETQAQLNQTTAKGVRSDNIVRANQAQQSSNDLRFDQTMSGEFLHQLGRVMPGIVSGISALGYLKPARVIKTMPKKGGSSKAIKVPAVYSNWKSS